MIYAATEDVQGTRGGFCIILDVENGNVEYLKWILGHWKMDLGNGES